MLKLKEVIISITNRCNSFCRMCDIPKEHIEELSTPQWKRVIEDAYSIGASTIVFSGGEPLLRKDIFELISYVKNNNMTACVTSNGLLIDQEKASELSLAGINVVNISIEGPKEIHNYLREDGTFEKAISALNNLKKYKIERTLATVVSRYNYKDLSYIVESARECGATTVKFQPFNALFVKNKSIEGDFLISKKEAVELNQIIKEVISLCNRYGITTNPLSYLERMPLYLTKTLFDYNGGCKALWTSCPINSNGEIYPCWVLAKRDRLIGNLKERRLVELWNSIRHNFIREKIKKEGCLGCMMSCYDEAFGGDNIERKIVMNIGRLKKEGFSGYVKRFLKRWLKRFKFYSSYRGTLKDVIDRIERFFRKERLTETASNNEEIRRVLREIERIKQIFKEDMGSLK